MARKNFIPLKTAEELFTDREEPRLAFWNELKQLESDPMGRGRVICFYGEGGIGKTWLLNRISRDLLRLKDNNVSDIGFDTSWFKAEYVPIYYELEQSSNIAEILCSLRVLLFKAKPHFEFPVFDYAIRKYEDLTGRKILPDLSYTDSRLRTLDDIFDKVSLIPGIDSIGDLYRRVKEAKNWIDSIRELDSIFSGIQDKIVREQIRDVERIDTTEDLLRALPEYFAADLSDEERDFSIVFLIDTFEILNPNGDLSNDTERILKDQLARGKASQIAIEDVLWVFAGRNRIYDDDTVPQHLIGDLSYEDTLRYLQKQEISEKATVDRIYEITGGTPIFLDVCVRNYIAEGYPSAQDFKVIDRSELIRRYLRYRNDEERLIIRTMSSIMHWTDSDFETVFTQAYDVPWRVYKDAYHNVIQTTMIEKINEERYFLHRSVRTAIYDDPGYDPQDRKLVLDALLKTYGEKMKDEDSDRIYYKERVCELILAIVGRNRPIDTTQFKKLLKIIADSYESVSICGFSHLNSYTDALNRLLGDVGEEKRKILILSLLSMIYRYGKRYEKALETDRQLYELNRSLYGEEHANTLDSLDDLAFDYSLLGDHEKALELNEEILKKKKMTQSEEDTDVLDSLSDRAYYFSSLGEYEKALELLKQVYEKRKALYGEDDPETLLSLHNLAFAYGDLEEYEKACELDQTILEKRKKIQGEDHPDTLQSLHDLAFDHKYRDDPKQSAALFQEAFERRKNVLGEDHPDTLDSQYELAVALGTMGEQEKAIALLKDVYERRKNVLGEEDPDTLHTGKLLDRVTKE